VSRKHRPFLKQLIHKYGGAALASADAVTSHRTLISVVIPCDNQGRFLEEAVASAASASYRVEVIVVDDGSTDDTAAVAARHGSVRYVHQRRRGLPAARNRGLDAATGDLVIFLDADARLLPGGIDAGARALAANPDCAMAYGRCVMTGPDGTEWPTPQQRRVLSGHYAMLLRTNPIWTPGMAIFRRAALRAAGGFAAGFDGAADYDLYLRIAAAHPVHDHGILVATCRCDGGAMRGSATLMLRDTLLVMRRHRPGADTAHLAAWCEGYKAWQEFYGAQLSEEIEADLRALCFGAAVAKAYALARHAPAILRREAHRTVRTLLPSRRAALHLRGEAAHLR